MSRRDELIEIYARDLEEKTGEAPDMDLLREVTIACGPSIYDADAGTVAASDTDELNRVRENFLIGRLGLPDDESLMGGIQKVVREYGRDDPRKHRAALYYLLVKHFGKADAFS